MTLSARLTAIEQEIAKLAARKEPKVSEMLAEGRRRLLAGKLEPQIHDVSQLERDAMLPGIRGQMAQGQLRILRWAPQEPAGTGVPPPEPPRPCTPPADPLVSEIDQLLVRRV